MRKPAHGVARLAWILEPAEVFVMRRRRVAYSVLDVALLTEDGEFIVCRWNQRMQATGPAFSSSDRGSDCSRPGDGSEAFDMLYIRMTAS